MRNSKTLKYKPTKLFAHQEDQAFELLARLEGFFARMTTPRGSRFLRERMQRASARLAEIVILGCDDERADRLSLRYEPAIMLCKIVDGMLRLLSEYAGLTSIDLQEALNITRALMRVIARRYFGFDVKDTDDGSSSSGAPAIATSPLLPVPGGGFGIAAETPATAEN
jgi:ribosomal protein L34